MSDILNDTDKSLTNAIKIGAVGDGTAYCKIGDNPILLLQNLEQ